jgi:acetyl/propionyl-CoA carboxylase alpha subunit
VSTSVAVYSEADTDAPHVRLADEAVAIGRRPARESYLVVEKLIAAAARAAPTRSIPGYGFLAENARFAAARERRGPHLHRPPRAGDRDHGRQGRGACAHGAGRRARSCRRPGVLAPDAARVRRRRDALGFPVVIKAPRGAAARACASSGAPRSFRRRSRARARGDGGASATAASTSSAISSGPRHVEVQIFADTHGTVVHLGERECSIQRRHQKIVEESPSPAVDATLRAAMTDAGIRAAAAVDYVGAGTIEFLLDAQAASTSSR